jgi:hypothetical protein
MAGVVGMPCVAAVSGVFVMTRMRVMHDGSCCRSRGGCVMHVTRVIGMLVMIGVRVMHHCRLCHFMRLVCRVIVLRLPVRRMVMRMIVLGMAVWLVLRMIVLVCTMFFSHRALLPLCDSVRISRRFLTEPYGVSLDSELI